MKKRKIKKFEFHPAVTYLILIILTILLSFIFSLFDFQSTYYSVNGVDNIIDQTAVTVTNLLSFSGLKEIISNATVNFISFTPLSMYLLSAIGICVCEASGYLDVLFKRVFSKINGRVITFIIIFLATISSIINEIGFVILIPIAALIYKSKNRNPLVGIVAAFCGVAFSTGTSIFVGSLEASLIPYTTSAAGIIDSTYHISLLSNLFIMIASSIILSIVGTIVIEKIISPKLSKYFNRVKKEETIELIDEIENIDDDLKIEQKNLETEYHEKRGFRIATIISIIYLLIFIYSLIPNLPFSGLLLDTTQDTYLKQVFGSNSYFQDGFTFMISTFFFVTGLSYGIGAKTFTDSFNLVEKCENSLKEIGNIVLLLFFSSQFISIFKMSNIGSIFTSILSNFLNNMSFGGLPLLIIAFIFIAISNLFLTSTESKYKIYAAILIPTLMKSNISPQFVQFMIRGADSITNGITPLYAYLAIFVGYLNIYNNNDKPITLFKSIRIIFPYFVIISIVWLLIILGWYIIGLPIGPYVYPIYS